MEAEGKILDIQCHQSPDIFGVNFSIIRKNDPLQVLNFHTEIRELELGQRVWIGANSKETTKYVIARVFDKKIKDFENKV